MRRTMLSAKESIHLGHCQTRQLRSRTYGRRLGLYTFISCFPYSLREVKTGHTGRTRWSTTLRRRVPIYTSDRAHSSSIGRQICPGTIYCEARRRQTSGLSHSLHWRNSRSNNAGKFSSECKNTAEMLNLKYLGFCQRHLHVSFSRQNGMPM